MGRIDLENFPTSRSALRMLDDVSTGFYENSYVGKWLYQIMGIEYDDAFQLVETLTEQFFIETATWGLRYHEEKWQLSVREDLSFEERRRLIYRKMAYRAPMTPYWMEKYLLNATGYKVSIADCHDLGEYGYKLTHPNRFRADFTVEGTLDVKKVKRILNNIKQSHTIFSIYDRIADVMDNKNLEYFMLVRLMIFMRIPFWGCHIFDGTWIFDGSGLMDAKRRYDLRMSLKYYMGTVYSLSGSYGLLFDGTWNPDGSGRFDAEYSGGYVDIRRNLWYFDGTECFDGSKKLNAMYRREML